MNFTLKILNKNDKLIRKVSRRTKRRFTNQIRTIKWRKIKRDGGSVYLKVFYGRGKNDDGKMVNFYNDGFYKRAKDFWLAFTCFSENVREFEV